MAGSSKFNVWKLWNLALEGVTSFSTVPLRLWSYVGGAISLFAVFYAVYMVFDKIFFGNSVRAHYDLGYMATVSLLLTLFGLLQKIQVLP